MSFPTRFSACLKKESRKKMQNQPLRNAYMEHSEGAFLKMSFNLSRMKIVRLRLENHSAEKSLEMSVGGGKNGLQA